MSEMLSETRYRRAALTRAREWKAVAVLDADMVEKDRCSECLARLKETCRTSGKFPEARTIHYSRMVNRDLRLRKGFGA